MLQADNLELNDLRKWINGLYPSQLVELNFAASDAGCRKYYRAILQNQRTLMIMQTPPEEDILSPYIQVQQLFQGVRVPEIYHFQLERGWMALEDFGDNTFIRLLKSNVDPEWHKALLLKAVFTLISIQTTSQPDKLPPYSEEELSREMDLFVEWCIPKYYLKTMTDTQWKTWQAAKSLLLSSILNQPCVYVHRDYIIRNLMLLEDQTVGVIDFQDARWGSICYDLLSLTRDAFITWDEAFTLDLVIRYWENAKRVGLPVNSAFDTFYQQYEWIGVQRHLKVAGIFARLKFRDQKDAYLNEIPRILQYLKNTTRRYQALLPLYQLLLELTGPDVTVEKGFTF
ncbi:MAG: phosphotransferase [Neisseriaceae bacterium]